MDVSGNMATVTMKYSQPIGSPYGLEVVDPGFRVNLSVPVSEVG